MVLKYCVAIWRHEEEVLHIEGETNVKDTQRDFLEHLTFKIWYSMQELQTSTNLRG